MRIRGAVQGVGFRYQTRGRAQSLGLGGFVANLPDGSVEAVFEGEDDQVDSMVEWCRHGPRGAWVEDVAVTSEHPTGEQDFAVR